jgi:hypothetical protein
MLELGLRLCKLGAQGVNHVGLFGTRVSVLEPTLHIRCAQGRAAE